MLLGQKNIDDDAVQQAMSTLRSKRYKRDEDWIWALPDWAGGSMQSARVFRVPKEKFASN